MFCASRFKVVKSKNWPTFIPSARVLMQIPTLSDEIIHVLRNCKTIGKPITVCSAGGDYVLGINRKLEKFGIPVYPSPERAVKAMKILYEYGKIVKRK